MIDDDCAHANLRPVCSLSSKQTFSAASSLSRSNLFTTFARNKKPLGHSVRRVKRARLLLSLGHNHTAQTNLGCGVA
jgi:hypothetical protein